MKRTARYIAVAATALYAVTLFVPVVKDSTASVDTGLGLLLRFLFYSVNPLALFGYLAECPHYLLQLFVVPSAFVVLFGAFIPGRRLWVRIITLILLALGLTALIIVPARPGAFSRLWGWYPLVLSYAVMLTAIISGKKGQQDDKII